MRNPYPLVQRMCNEIGGSGSCQVLNEYDCTWLYPAFVLLACVMMTKCLVPFPAGSRLLAVCKEQRRSGRSRYVCGRQVAFPTFQSALLGHDTTTRDSSSGIRVSTNHYVTCYCAHDTPLLPHHPSVFVYCKRSKTGLWWRPGNEARTSWLWSLGMRLQNFA